MGNAYRWPRERRYRRVTLPSADLFLPATERARRCLLLEGADAGRIRVCPPGIELERFAVREARPPAAGGHLVLSVGEAGVGKGHHEVLRAHRGPARRSGRGGRPGGRETDDHRRGSRGEAHCADTQRSSAWGNAWISGRPCRTTRWCPSTRARRAWCWRASPTKGWEEQFGMVLAEAMAAGLPVVASASRAIPEVMAGQARLFEPGDWSELAAALAAGPRRTHRASGGPMIRACWSGTPPRRAPTACATPTASCWPVTDELPPPAARLAIAGWGTPATGHLVGHPGGGVARGPPCAGQPAAGPDLGGRAESRARAPLGGRAARARSAVGSRDMPEQFKLRAATLRRALRRSGPLDGFVLLGADVEPPAGWRFVLLSDMTLALALEVHPAFAPLPDWVLGVLLECVAAPDRQPRPTPWLCAL